MTPDVFLVACASSVALWGARLILRKELAASKLRVDEYLRGRLAEVSLERDALTRENIALRAELARFDAMDGGPPYRAGGDR